MSRFARLMFVLGGMFALLARSLPANAQDDEPSAVSLPPLPPPSSARAPNGEYVAPLAQQTQRTYVPQSVAMSGPAQLRNWREGDPVPDGYHKTTRLRTSPIVGGGVTFGILYTLSLFAASIAADSAGTSPNPDTALYIPAIGPFIQMGNTETATGRFVLAFDGVGQSLGLALLIYGLTSPQTVVVRNDLAKATIVPVAGGKDGYGLGVRATF